MPMARHCGPKSPRSSCRSIIGLTLAPGIARLSPTLAHLAHEVVEVGGVYRLGRCGPLIRDERSSRHLGAVRGTGRGDPEDRERQVALPGLGGLLVVRQPYRIRVRKSSAVLTAPGGAKGIGSVNTTFIRTPRPAPIAERPGSCRDPA